MAGLPVLGGGLGLVLLAVTTARRADLPGLDAYPSAYVGDLALLPAAAAIMAGTAAHLPPARRDRLLAAVTGVAGALAGAATQLLWLADNHPRPNWTLPRAHHFNGAGVFHATYLSIVSGLLAFLCVLVLARLRAVRRTDPLMVRSYLRSWPTAVLIGCLLSDVVLLVHDSSAATLSSRTTLVALAATTIVAGVLLSLLLGSSSKHMAGPGALGLLAAVGAGLLATPWSFPTGSLLGLVVTAAVTVAAMFAVALPRPTTPIPSADVTALWLGAGCCALGTALLGIWVRAAPLAAAHKPVVAIAPPAAAACILLCVIGMVGWRRAMANLDATAVLVTALVVAGAAVWFATAPQLAYLNALGGLLLVPTVGWWMFPTVTERFDLHIAVEGDKSYYAVSDELPKEQRRNAVIAIVFLVAAYLAVTCGLLSYGFSAFTTTTYRETHGWPARLVTVTAVGVVTAVVLGTLALLGARVRRTSALRRLLRWTTPFAMLPWLVTLAATAGSPLEHRPPWLAWMIGIEVTLASALAALWGLDSALVNTFLLRIRRVDAPGTLLVSSIAASYGLTAYWILSSAATDGTRVWAVGSAIAAAFGVFGLHAAVVVTTAAAAAPPAPGMPRHGFRYNVGQDAVVFSLLFVTALILPLMIAIHVRVGNQSMERFAAPAAVVLTLLTFLACAYKWVTRNSTSHVEREVDTRATDPTGTRFVLSDERTIRKSVALLVDASLAPLANDRQTRFLRVLNAHTVMQNALGRAVLSLLVVPRLATLEVRPSRVPVQHRDL